MDKLKALLDEVDRAHKNQGQVCDCGGANLCDVCKALMEVGHHVWSERLVESMSDIELTERLLSSTRSTSRNPLHSFMVEEVCRRLLQVEATDS